MFARNKYTHNCLFCSQWMYLERMFSSPDIKEKLVEEKIQFKRVDRTWRRIMKDTSNKPWVRDMSLYHGHSLITH